METRIVGVLGGGQLGRMMAEAGHRLGIRLACLDPGGKESPAGKVAEFAIQGSYRNREDIMKLADIADVLTVEIEHVDVQTLEMLQERGIVVHPDPSSIRIIQDKYLQKQSFQGNVDIRMPDFMEVASPKEALKAGEDFGYPYLLKAKCMAYDGRGNRVVTRAEEAEDAYHQLLANSDNRGVYAEKFVNFKMELAVLVVRQEEVSPSGDKNVHLSTYPAVETIQKDNICHIVHAPAQISPVARQHAEDMAKVAVSELKGSGIFAVEMFLSYNDEVYLNEIAPRPHNSGHHTIESSECDQFENHLRALLGLPLGSTALRVGAAMMINILGSAEGKEATLAPARIALSIPGASVHWYGKSEARKGRKMGHITVTGLDRGDCLSRIAPLNITEGERGGMETSSLGQAMIVAHERSLGAGVIEKREAKAVVGIIMGSDSDLPTMRPACDILDEFGILYECTIVSAHRTPHRMFTYATGALDRGLKVIIAGAGGAAHLPGMVAALTPLPVIGVPVKSSTLSGVDSLYSIVQMPRGVPVATVAIGNGMNAGLLAARICGFHAKTRDFMDKQEEEVFAKIETLHSQGVGEYMKEHGMA